MSESGMHGFLRILKSILIGGLLFLLPLGIIIFVFGELMKIARDAGHAIAEWLPEGPPIGPPDLIIAVFLLVLIALAAGLIARTKPGRSVFRWFEDAILSNLPMYTVYRQMIPNMGESFGEPGKDDLAPIVAVHLDDQTRLGFLVDTVPSGRKIVYLPIVPSALWGDIIVVDPERVETMEMKAAQFLFALQKMGGGIAAGVARLKRQPRTASPERKKDRARSA